MSFTACFGLLRRVRSLNLLKRELMKELPGPKTLNVLKCLGDAGALRLDEPDEAAGRALEVL
eukprot:2500110-Alexandrium_andersonii.AAC.1